MLPATADLNSFMSYNPYQRLFPSIENGVNQPTDLLLCCSDWLLVSLLALFPGGVATWRAWPLGGRGRLQWVTGFGPRNLLKKEGSSRRSDSVLILRALLRNGHIHRGRYM